MSSQQTLVSRSLRIKSFAPSIFEEDEAVTKLDAQLCTLGVVVSTNTSQFSSLLELKYPC